MDTLEKCHIYIQTKLGQQINDKNTVHQNILFDKLIQNSTDRGLPWTSTLPTALQAQLVTILLPTVQLRYQQPLDKHQNCKLLYIFILHTHTQTPSPYPFSIQPYHIYFYIISPQFLYTNYIRRYRYIKPNIFTMNISIDPYGFDVIPKRPWLHHDLLYLTSYI